MQRRDHHDRWAVLRRLAPVAALMVLAPWSAECSWGGFTVRNFPLVVLFLGPMYGGAVVLIRETARRTGGGWPVLILLAAAFGVVQAGLVDQSLFNPGFLADTQFAGQDSGADATRVAALHLSVDQALTFVGNHIALSVCAPIAIVESMVSPRRRRQPWLHRPGLVVMVLVYLAGSLLIFQDEDGRGDFLAGPGLLAGTAAVVLLLVGAAMLPHWRHPGRRARGRVPLPVVPGLMVLVTFLVVNLVEGWIALLVSVAVIALTATAIIRWSRRAGWRQSHILVCWAAAMAGAALLAYAAPTYAPSSPGAAMLADVVVSLLTLALFTAAYLRLRQQRAGHGPAVAS